MASSATASGHLVAPAGSSAITQSALVRARVRARARARVRVRVRVRVKYYLTLT